jgi:glycine betaine transporter
METEPTRTRHGLPGPHWISVFTVSLVVCGAAAVWGALDPQGLADAISLATRLGLEWFDWIFLLSVTIFITLCLFLALSRFGGYTLGSPGEEPEFSTVSWLAMLFAAGMGAGLLFWGVAEPLNHFMSPPPGQEAMTPGAARRALVMTNLHWGIHAWGIYAMGALVLGYFGFRKNLPMLAGAPIRHVFPGVFGKALGGVADLVAVLAVVFGLAGSLGMGVLQINYGLSEVFGVDAESLGLSMAVLGVLAACYLISAATAIDKGIKLLSNLNTGLVVVLLLFVLFVGPTTFILSTFATSLGDYLSNIVNLSFRLHPFSGEREWTRVWTLTYLIWWIAWAPFVGIFIARISRGRTIREFVIVVMFLPTLFSVLWFSVFGGTGLHLELFGQGGLGSMVLENTSQTLFAFLGFFPFTPVLVGVSLFLIFIFLVTSAQSGSFVLGMMTTDGSLNPPTYRKLFWGAVVAVITAATLLAGGGVHTLRAIAVSGALPFTVIMIAQVACLFHALGGERPAPIEAPEQEEEESA